MIPHIKFSEIAELKYYSGHRIVPYVDAQSSEEGGYWENATQGKADTVESDLKSDLLLESSHHWHAGTKIYAGDAA